LVAHGSAADPGLHRRTVDGHGRSLTASGGGVRVVGDRAGRGDAGEDDFRDFQWLVCGRVEDDPQLFGTQFREREVPVGVEESFTDGGAGVQYHADGPGDGVAAGELHGQLGEGHSRAEVDVQGGAVVVRGGVPDSGVVAVERVPAQRGRVVNRGGRRGDFRVAARAVGVLLNPFQVDHGDLPGDDVVFGR